MNVDGVDPQILLLYRVSDVAGVLLMGIIGGTIARQRGFDIVGFLFIALFSALGGGMIRDVLINQGTVAAMAQPEYLILAFMGALIARFTYFKGRAWELFRVHGDAVVSGLWAATGCVKALTFDLPILSCVMMGVFTAVGGGMIRDVATGRVPGVFGNDLPTVIPAIATTAVVLGFDAAGLLAVGMVTAPLVGITLTLASYWFGWRLTTDTEWAPVNVAAGKVERGSRKVARGIEPRRVRTWRHRQMERALARREQRRGGRVAEPDADAGPEEGSELAQLRAEVQAEVEAEAGQVPEDTGGFGVDLNGDSYEAARPAETAETADAAERMSAADSGAPRRRLVEELIDVVLADDDLMDELLDKVERARGEEGRPGRGGEEH